MPKTITVEPWPVRRCSGPCEQGRRECPCPDACEAPEAPMTAHEGRIVLALLLAPWALAALVGLLMWWQA